MKDYYQILEVSLAATQEEIKKAWREQVQVWHPDRFNHNPSLLRKAEERTKLINEAFEVLGYPEKRRSYDARSRSGKRSDEEPRSSQADDTTITRCPNPDCAISLRIGKKGHLRVLCPDCGCTFVFDTVTGSKEDIWFKGKSRSDTGSGSRSGLPETLERKIRDHPKLRPAGSSTIRAFLELAGEVWATHPDDIEIRVTIGFVPFSLSKSEPKRNFTDVIDVSDGKIDLALKTYEPEYPFSDPLRKTRLIRPEVKKYRFGSYQREITLHTSEDVPYIRNLVLQCFNNLSRRLGL